jgi:hypothetical protein
MTENVINYLVNIAFPSQSMPGPVLSTRLREIKVIKSTLNPEGLMKKRELTGLHL